MVDRSAWSGGSNNRIKMDVIRRLPITPIDFGLPANQARPSSDAKLEKYGMKIMPNRDIE